MKTAQLFMDYQNVQLSAWESFTSFGTPVKEAQIHPTNFAKAVERK